MEFMLSGWPFLSRVEKAQNTQSDLVVVVCILRKLQATMSYILSIIISDITFNSTFVIDLDFLVDFIHVSPPQSRLRFVGVDFEFLVMSTLLTIPWMQSCCADGQNVQAQSVFSGPPPF